MASAVSIPDWDAAMRQPSPSLQGEGARRGSEQDKYPPSLTEGTWKHEYDQGQS